MHGSYSESELLRDYARLNPEAKARITKFVRDLIRLQRAEERLSREISQLNDRNSGENNDIYCDFCGKCSNDVERVIAGPNGYICNECIRLCNVILDEIAAEENGE